MSILGRIRTELWPYQEEDSTRVITRNTIKGSGMLGHQTGLGKTLIALSIIHRMNAQRVLVCGSKNALASWIMDVEEHTEGTVEYIGAKNPNAYPRWQNIVRSKEPGIFLVGHSFMRNLVNADTSFSVKTGKTVFEYTVLDEAHKAKNRKTELHDVLKTIRSEHRLELTATPASRGAQDMWAYLNRIDPRMFPSYWKFVNTFCYTDKSPYGGTDVYGTRNKDALKALLSKYYVSRKYADVKAQLPEIRREVVCLSMNKGQATLYNTLYSDMILKTPERLILTPGILARDIRLRQLALCPQALDPQLIRGVGIDYLDDEIELGDHHVVIFSQFTQVLNQVEAMLRSKDIPVVSLRGGMEPDELAQQIKYFKEHKTAVTCTISFAASFSLDTVNRAYVLGLDPDPILNIQAEGRLRRGNSVQAEGVLVRYIIIAGTREEEFQRIVNGKIRNVRSFLEDFGA